MSIASEISRLQGAKADIKAAIEAKGVTVPSAALLDSYDTYIAQISGGGGGLLPTGYTQLQYVTTDSTAWIDTGIAGATDLTIHIAFTWRTFVQYGGIYGNYIDESHNCNRAILTNQANTLYVAGGNNLAQNVINCLINTIHTLTVTSTTATLNGSITNITSASHTMNTDHICLGNRTVNNPSSRDIGLRIFHFYIERSGSKLIDLYPCVRDADSIAGFYDIVNNVFKRSDTATDFVAGTDVI